MIGMAKLQFLHHSFFKLILPECTLLMDPFVNIPSNVHVKPRTRCPASKRSFRDVNLILVSHEHFDHFDRKLIEDIVKASNATVVAYDNVLAQLNIKRSNKVPISANKKLNLKGVSIEAFHVHHPTSFYPLGFKIVSNGLSLIHTGDTFLMDSFSKLKADVLLVPIGGTMTMDITDAVKVVKNVQPKVAIPMHYNTFDIIKASPQEFREKLEDSVLETRPAILKPGKSIRL
ncbi:MAG: MBL fold metallo-hydrolase [Candidatus Diapherotrites archaeon]|nr:MBL fold metallo-hydrolase [Candidatus Diapherotrites archaeon]